MEDLSRIIQHTLLPAETRSKNKHTYFNTSFFDTYLLFWAGKFVNIGKRTAFQQDMHWDLRDSETSENLVANLSTAFEVVKHKKNPLLRSLWHVVKGIFLTCIFCAIINGLLQFVAPYLIKRIIAYIQDPQKDTSTGILLVLAIVFSRFFMSIFDARYRILLNLLGIRTSIALNGLLYEKALKFSLVRSIEHSLGSLTNNIEVDSEKLYYFGEAVGGVITFPLVIIVGVYLMYSVMGISFLSGIGVVAMLAAINIVIGKFYARAQEVVMEKKDERIKISSEILNGIKYIKMSGWEEAFLENVSRRRDQELSWLKKQLFAESFSIFCSWLTSTLITSALFGTYILLGHDMDAGVAFSMLSTMSVLELPLRAFPKTLTLALECKVAIERITKFLLAEEVQTSCIQRNDQTGSQVAIKVTKGNFFWLTEEEKLLKMKKEKENQQEKDSDGKRSSKTDHKNKKKKVLDQTQPLDDSLVVSSLNEQLLAPLPENDRNAELTQYRLVIQDIDIEIKKGSLIAILREVGSGKSSLLLSLVGEMKYDSENPPQVEINGTIINGTVKKNITFGQEFNEKKYQDAIKYSCLQADLDVLPTKDKTEIGEKGVNLSGGQKARVSLARSLYQDSDIYFFYDPLSAVDAHVGNFILKECFMNYLKDKTRILVTHKFECLKYVDYIYIFKKGKIVEQGSYENIKDSPILQEVEQKYKIISENENKNSNKEEENVEDRMELEETKEITSGADRYENLIKPTVKNKEVSVPGEPSSEIDNDIQQKLMLDEDRETGDISWKVWKSYFSYYGWTFIIALFVVMGLSLILSTASAFWLSFWSEDSNNVKYSNGFYFEFYVMLGCGAAILSGIRTILLTVQSVKCSRKIHKDMISKIIRASVNMFFDRVPIGRLLNRFSKDLTVLDNYITHTFGFFVVLVFCLLSDIFVCIVDGTVWVFPLVLLFFYLAYRIQRGYMEINREVVRLESISKSPIVSFLAESLGGLTSIRAYQEEGKFNKKFHELQDANIKNLILSAGLYSWFTLRVCFTALLIIVPSLTVPLLITTDSFSPGMAGLLITYVSFLTDDIIYLIWAISDVESKLISFERCKAFTQIQGEANPNTQNPHSVINYSQGWPIHGAIKFKNYCVKYRPNLPHVIKNFSLAIKPGEKIGVVGRTGSGKSTLFLSLLRVLEPDQGQIFIDEVDISEVGLDDLRRKITIIPQDPMLFRGTLRDNLDLFKKYTDEELWLSLERVCLKPKFEKENGLNTEIKESGDNLSAGEKQLLCIGRAILAQSRIILIDEATSNIDPNTEQTILDTIHNSFKDCTVLTIAHRLKTVINSDRILMMGDGQLIEFDEPKKLIDDETSIFHKLWKEYERAHQSHIN